jgi:glycosyltransferase involved in cell wall biosynthesis
MALRFCDRNIFISEDQALSVTSHLRVKNAKTIRSSLLNSDKRIQLSKVNKLKNYKGNRLYFLFFCWMTFDQIKRKGLRETLEAFAMLCERSDADVILRIGGQTGNAQRYVETLVSEHGLSGKVEFYFDLTSGEKDKLYINSHLFLCPSYLEGFGNACLEAMSFGMVALVSRYGASHEVVGDIGFVVPMVRSDEICNAMLKFVEFSGEERTLLAQRAMDRAYAEFAFDTRLKAIESLLKTDAIIPRSSVELS